MELQIHLFVTYKWEWSENASNLDESMATSPALSKVEPSQNEIPHVAANDSSNNAHCDQYLYWSNLRLNITMYCQRLLNSIDVKLQHEPYNSKAIVFVCVIGGKWERIGYVVQEALDDAIMH